MRIRRPCFDRVRLASLGVNLTEPVNLNLLVWQPLCQARKLHTLVHRCRNPNVRLYRMTGCLAGTPPTPPEQCTEPDVKVRGSLVRGAANLNGRKLGRLRALRQLRFSQKFRFRTMPTTTQQQNAPDDNNNGGKKAARRKALQWAHLPTFFLGMFAHGVSSWLY